jgi:hypothetical protein
MFGLYICASSHFFMGRTLNSSFSMLSLFFSVYVNRRRPANCTARIPLVAAKILLVATKILLVAMPRRDQWKKNSVGRNKNSVGRDEGRCSDFERRNLFLGFPKTRDPDILIDYQSITVFRVPWYPFFANFPPARMSKNGSF